MPVSSCSWRILHLDGMGVPYFPGILGALGLIVTVWKRWVARSLGGRGGGSYLLHPLNMLPYFLGWRGEGLVLMAAPSGIFTYGEIFWYWLLLDLYLMGDCLGARKSNGILIGRSLWRPAWCCFTRSMWYPLVWEIWSSIAREFLNLSWLRDRSGNCGLDCEIWSSLVISIGRSRKWLGVWSGYRDKNGFGLVGLVLVSSYGNSIDWGIAWAIGSSIGILEVRSIGGSLWYRTVGRSLWNLFGRSQLIRDWSWWPCLQGTIGES